MKHSNKDSKEGLNRLSKKRLLSDEYRQYKLFGEPDLSQNWLELFTPTVVSDLFTIMKSCSNNQKKAKYIEKEMAYYGFENVGLGTNVYVMSNPAYPGVVFKFAVDENGIADNFNDAILQDMIPRYTRVLARHPSAIVSVQERRVLIKNQDRMDTFRGSILKTLRELSKTFLIVDLSPTNYHLNYGIDRNGDWCFVDASDLYPLDNIKHDIRCNKAIGWDDKHHKVKYCGGRFKYDADFSHIVCSKCGMERLPLEVRPDDKEGKSKMANSMMDGTTMDEREELRQKEMAAIYRGNEEHRDEPILSTEDDDTPDRPSKRKPRNIFIGPSDDEDEQEDVEHSTPEPTREQIQETHTAFEGESEPPSNTDEEEEEEMHFTPVVDPPPPEVLESVDLKQELENQQADIADKLHYDVVNVGSENKGSPGITINITGDFDTAYEDYGLPIYVNFGDGETCLAINSETMKKILDQVIPGIIEDRKDMNAYYSSLRPEDKNEE